MGELERLMAEFVDSAQDKLAAVEELREFLHSLSPTKVQPIDRVRWVPIDKVTPNDYNPNSVARTEMKLLLLSIQNDGYTQPVVTIWDSNMNKYVIVDGFHRYYTMKMNPEVMASTGGMLPIVVLRKEINDRMAATVRHNRARGKHSVKGMSSMVFSLLEGGWSDEEVCNELGMDPEELLRLKHITGFSKLFANVDYKKSWVTERQIKIAKTGKPT